MRAALTWQTGSMRPQARTHTPRLLLVRQSGALLSGVLIGDNGQPIDISDSAASVLFSVRLAGSDTLTAQVTCTKLAGREGINGFVNTAAPYDVAGAGGRFQVPVPASAFDVAGDYEGELVFFASPGADPQVIFDVVRILVRDNLYGRPVGQPPTPPSGNGLLGRDGRRITTRSGNGIGINAGAATSAILTRSGDRITTRSGSGISPRIASAVLTRAGERLTTRSGDSITWR